MLDRVYCVFVIVMLYLIIMMIDFVLSMDLVRLLIEVCVILF